MLVFDVFVNGKAMCRAGAGEGVLTAIASWLGSTNARGKPRPETISLHVSGIVNPDQHVTWLDQFPVKRGDKITIEVLEAENADEPRARQRPSRPNPADHPKLRLAKRGKRASSS
jgi:hypothetical protein